MIEHYCHFLLTWQRQFLTLNWKQMYFLILGNFVSEQKNPFKFCYPLLGNFRANLPNSIKLNLQEPSQELLATTDPTKLIAIIQHQLSLLGASESPNLVLTRSCEQRAGTGFLPNPDYLELKQL